MDGQFVDFRVRNHGTVWTFTPLTKAAKAAVETMDLEDWQWQGESFAVDHRPARALVEVLEYRGFVCF